MIYKSGNTILGFTVVASLIALAVVFVNPVSDIFLGAQVGRDNPTAPGAPTLISAVGEDSKIVLSWTAPASNGGAAITSYTVRYTTGGTTRSAVTGTSATSYNLTGLTNDLTYSVVVAATNSAGTGTYSNQLTATPTAPAEEPPSGNTVPDAPTGLVATSGNGEIALSWTAPASNGGSAITGYTISYTPVGGVEQTSTTAGTTATIRNLSNGTSYSIRVRATNEVGNSEWSSTVSESPEAPATIPETPQSLTLTAGDTTLALSWTAPASDGGSAITSYTISYTPTGGSEQTVNVANPNATSYTIESLTNGLAYSVKIRAVNAIGNGLYTTASSASPDENTLPQIVGVPSVSPSDTSALITWSTNKNTSTRVDFGMLTTSSSTPEYNQNTRVVNHSVTVLNLLPCTTYSYIVRSYDALSRSVSSSEQSFTTSGCVVSNPTISSVARNSIDTSVGGTLNFVAEGVKTKLTIPSNLKTGQTDVVFQVRKLEKTEVKEEIGLPAENTQWLGDHVYDIAAYNEELSEEVNNFDNPLSVTIVYSRADVQNINPETLKIHHYEDETGWKVLTSCVNNYNQLTGGGEITCSTESFSIFGLFGENSSSNTRTTGTYLPNQNPFTTTTTTTSVTENTTVIQSESEDKTQEESLKITKEDIIVPEATPVIDKVFEGEISQDVARFFVKDLWFGLSDSADVYLLQRFLNATGFILAEKGAGSPGKETGYFGPRTHDALMRFQTVYQNSIITPTGPLKATGYLDYFTRMFIQSNF